VVTPNSPPQRITNVRICNNQEERHHYETLAHTIDVQTVTDGISRRVTTGRENTSLILVYRRVKVIEGCYRNVMLLKQLLPAMPCISEFSLSAGHCPARTALEAVNFLTDDFARYRLILKILSRQTHQ